MDVSGAVDLGALLNSVDLSGAQMATWCGVCNSAPSIGEIRVEHEQEEMPTVAICESCIKELAMTQDIPGWTDEWDGLDITNLV